MNIENKKCKRCGYEWIPRTIQEPRECPDCKNRYWNKDYVRGIKNLKLEVKNGKKTQV